MLAILQQEEHEKIVEEGLKRMEEHNLYLKPEKCVWKVKEVEFLGLVIREEGINGRGEGKRSVGLAQA